MDFIVDCKLMTLANGKKVIKYKRHTYSNTGRMKGILEYRWNCTNKKCPAYLRVSIELDIRKEVDQHNHPVPKYVKNGNVYVPMDWYDGKHNNECVEEKEI